MAASSWPDRALRAAACLLLAAGCAFAEQAAPILPIPVRFPDGFTIHAEVARTPAEHAQGLMGRGELPYDAGMLFVYEQDGARSVWMKDTLVSLDIIILSPERRVREIFASVPPTAPETPPGKIPTIAGHGQYVLEVPAGTAKRHRLTVGDVLEFDAGAE